VSIVLLHAAAVRSRLPEASDTRDAAPRAFAWPRCRCSRPGLLDGFRVERSTGYCRSAQEEQRSSSDRGHNRKPDSEFAFQKSLLLCFQSHWKRSFRNWDPTRGTPRWLRRSPLSGRDQRCETDWPQPADCLPRAGTSGEMKMVPPSPRNTPRMVGAAAKPVRAEFSKRRLDG